MVEGRSRKVNYVRFHIGVNVTNAIVTNMSQVGSNGVQSIELLDSGVYIKLTRKNEEEHVFVPFSNITQVSLDVSAAETKTKKPRDAGE